MAGLGSTYAFFEDQFEPEGDAYLFRARKVGPAYRVTLAERDAFVSQFKWKIRATFACLMVVILVVMFTFLNRFEGLDAKENVGLFAGLFTSFTVIVFVVPYLIVWRRAVAAPARAMESRRAVAPALSAQVIRRNFFRKLSYGQLAIVPFVPLIFLIPGRGHRDWINPMHGWARLWWILVITCVILAAVQAYRKWKFDNNGET